MRRIVLDKKNGFFRFCEWGVSDTKCKSITVTVLDTRYSTASKIGACPTLGDGDCSLVRFASEWCILEGVKLPISPKPVTLTLTCHAEYVLEVK